MNSISLTILIAAGALGTAMAALLTSCIRAWAQNRLLDVPNERSSHVSPRARGGGLAVVAVVLGGLLLYSVQVGTWRFAAYLSGALLIAVVSFLDDIRPVSSRVRLLLHSAAALIAIGSYTSWHGAALPFLDELPGVATAVTFLWIVGLTNAYNFMDGIDGLAGAQGIITGLAWCSIGVLSASPATALAGVLAAAASAGFLVHNWPPARIFMGDVGAAFLGYTFAVLPLMTDPLSPNLFAAGMLAVGVFVFDTSFTFLRRLAARENVFRAHRSHLYQRLIVIGHTHGAVTLFYAALAVAHAGAAVLVVLLPEYAIFVWLLSGIAVSGALWLTVLRKERRERRRVPRHALQSG